MKRQTLHNALSKVAEVRQLSNRENKIHKNTLILAKKPQVGSTTSSIAGFQLWEVMCYVPSTSIVALDLLTEQVIKVLKDLQIELTGNITPEFYDDSLKAYMVSIEFRIPKIL